MEEIPATIPIIIKQSKKRRRSVSLIIRDEGVVVLAPFKYSQKYIHEIIAEKRQWIEEKWAEQQIKKEKNTKVFSEGSTIPYFGEKYAIKIQGWGKKKTLCEKKDDFFLFSLPFGTLPEHKKQLLETSYMQWLKKEAQEILPQKVFDVAEKHKFLPQKVFIRSYTRKYGMCQGKDIYLDYKIIELPENIIDHIILHELTHLIHKHHKPSFRKKLSELDSDWKKNRDFLRGKIDE